MASRPAITAAALGAALALTALSGCGVETQDAGEPARFSTTPTSPPEPGSRTSTTATRAPAVLPKRPAGTVAVVGGNDVFTRRLTAGAETASKVNVAFSATTASRSYSDLCNGRVDVIQTSQAPTQAEYKACSAKGLEIVDPIQVGSDAIVVATKNESDVGGDCITVQQARDIFRSGSPYTNWSQLGFFDLPLHVTGREDGSSNFQFFGFEVLGLPNATIADVRSDYRVRTTDARERREVTNANRLDRALRRIREYRTLQVAKTRGARRRAVDRAVAAADRRVLAEIDKINARNKRLRIDVDAASLARSNRRKVETAKRAAALEANADFDRRIDRGVLSYSRTVLAAASAPGVVGPFRFSYYELFEEQLRPLEIDFGGAETASGQPIRFGDLSEFDQARLAPTVAAAQRTLAAQSAAASGATTTTTTPTTTARAADIDPTTTLTGLNATQLPARTADGQRIYAGPNCVFPAQLTITNGSYPLTRRIFYVTTKTGLKRPEVRTFLTNVLDNAQRLAPGERLVPITDQQRRQAYITVTGAPPSDQTVATTTTTTATTTTGTATGPTGATGVATAGTTTEPATTAIPGVSTRGGVPAAAQP